MIPKKRNFKVGDKVMGIGGDIEGCIGIIEEIMENGYAIKLLSLGNSPWHGQTEWQIGNTIRRLTFWEGCLKLIKSRIPPNSRLEKETKELLRRME